MHVARSCRSQKAQKDRVTLAVAPAALAAETDVLNASKFELLLDGLVKAVALAHPYGGVFGSD